MDDKKLQNIIQRIEKLERIVLSDEFNPPKRPHDKNGKRNLKAIAQNRLLSNGQEKIAAIVGYHEKILQKNATEQEIKQSWIDGKFTGNFAHMLVHRAIVNDGLIRKLKDATFDLSQAGEEFFEKLLGELS